MLRILHNLYRDLLRTGYHILCLFVLLHACSAHTVRAQDSRPKSQLSIGLGKPRHPDMDVDRNGFLVSVNYLRNACRFFGWGLMFLRASASSKLDFFDNTPMLMDYLNKGEPLLGLGTTWSAIETYAAGGQLHFTLINNKKHLCSVSGGLGVYRSTSSGQGLGMVTEETLYTSGGELLESRITGLERVVIKETKTEPFFFPALYYQYAPGGDFFVGLRGMLLLDLDTEPLTTHPVLANFYSLELHLGRRF